MGNFNMLPEEIMSEILRRVPAEYILECKWVSKPCRKLIKQLSMHLNQHLSGFDSAGKLSFIFHTQGTDREPIYYAEYDENLNRFTRTTRINLRPEFKNSYIQGSVNGLVCFNEYVGGRYPQPAYICNPDTREYIVLPIDERKPFLCGFGYSPSTNEYKVVRVCQGRRDPKYGIIQVYTLGSGMGWRDLSKVVYFNLVAFHQCGVFVNGAIHWVDREGTIVAFNLIDEEFRQLPSPSWLSPAVDVVLHGFGDFLCACNCRSAGYFDVWVLKDNKIWSKDFSRISGRPINFTKTGGLLCYNYRDKNVYFYASKASSSRMLVSSGNNIKFGVPHRNTLVSLKTLGEEHTKLMDSEESIDHLSTEQKKETNL